MHISEELLFNILSESYTVKRFGRILNLNSLPIPQFYNPSEPLTAGSVYITRTFDLPKSPKEKCLFICIGKYSPAVWSSWNSEVFFIESKEVDFFLIFNSIQKIYQRLYDWEQTMELLLSQDADVRKMLQASMLLLNNRICVTDYNFSILAHCKAVITSDERCIQMVDDYQRIPSYISTLFMNEHPSSQLHKDPFFMQSSEGEIRRNNYCIHLFIGDIYMGTCSLTEDGRKITEADMMLFQFFAQYITKAISQQSRHLNSTFVSIKTIFSELLQNIPVSSQKLAQALKVLAQEQNANADQVVHWHCLTLRSVNHKKTLPGEYICETLEDLLPKSAALLHDDIIVCFINEPSSASVSSVLKEKLEPYLEDMNFQAGCSYPFSDLFQARNFYLQAGCAMEYCNQKHTRISYFSDCALEYMLKQSCSSFEAEFLMPPGLLKLRGLSGSIDYWETLRKYLDNECNASKTAEELFLHRSSLLPRLEKIKSYVSLDTPKERLYLRMCMYLYDFLHENA